MLVYKQIMWKVTLCAKISRLEEWLWEKSLLYATFDNLLEEWLSGSLTFIGKLINLLKEWLREITFIGKFMNLLEK